MCDAKKIDKIIETNHGRLTPITNVLVYQLGFNYILNVI